MRLDRLLLPLPARKCAKKSEKKKPKNISDAVLSFVALSHGPHKLTRPAQRAEKGAPGRMGVERKGGERGAVGNSISLSGPSLD